MMTVATGDRVIDPEHGRGVVVLPVPGGRRGLAGAAAGQAWPVAPLSDALAAVPYGSWVYPNVA